MATLDRLISEKGILKFADLDDKTCHIVFEYLRMTGRLDADGKPLVELSDVVEEIVGYPASYGGPNEELGTTQPHPKYHKVFISPGLEEA